MHFIWPNPEARNLSKNRDHRGNAPLGGKPQPFHVVNVALNLVRGEKLAWQQRKATSFTITPLHCGSFHVGYRAVRMPQQNERVVRCYGGMNEGITLGTAVAISGAAASPNMGYHSS